MSMRRPASEEELSQLLGSLTEPAPAELRANVAEIAGRSVEGRRRERSRALVLAPAALALAALASLLIAILPGPADRNAPPAAGVAAAALAAPEEAAPPRNSASPSELARSVEGVAFPYWEDNTGWRAVGYRSDTVAGREVTTVLYEDPATRRRAGYAIVAGVSKLPDGGTTVVRGGETYRLLSLGGARAVVWLREGHLCVIASSSTDEGTLLKLAGA